VNTKIIETKEIPAAINIGNAYPREEIVERIPPRKGPRINAAPNTPDEMEKTAVRVFGVDMSAKDLNDCHITPQKSIYKSGSY
jgi:hypothetical protein